MLATIIAIVSLIVAVFALIKAWQANEKVWTISRAIDVQKFLKESLTLSRDYHQALNDVLQSINKESSDGKHT